MILTTEDFAKLIEQVRANDASITKLSLGISSVEAHKHPERQARICVHFSELMAALEFNRTVTTLELTASFLSLNMVRNLAVMLKNNTYLHTLDLSNTTIGKEPYLTVCEQPLTSPQPIDDQPCSSTSPETVLDNQFFDFVKYGKKWWFKYISDLKRVCYKELSTKLFSPEDFLFLDAALTGKTQEPRSSATTERHNHQFIKLGRFADAETGHVFVYGLWYLTEALKVNRSLKKLVLLNSECDKTRAVGISYIAEMLAVNTSLTEISFSANIGKAAILRQLIVDALQQNHTLTHLVASGTFEEDLVRVNTLLARNRLELLVKSERIAILEDSAPLTDSASKPKPRIVTPKATVVTEHSLSDAPEKSVAIIPGIFSQSEEKRALIEKHDGENKKHCRCCIIS